eukprot:scaffold1762_cov383-Prasinococcus_capsulatus_cf.AAC.18
MAGGMAGRERASPRRRPPPTGAVGSSTALGEPRPATNGWKQPELLNGRTISQEIRGAPGRGPACLPARLPRCFVRCPRPAPRALVVAQVASFVARVGGRRGGRHVGPTDKTCRVFHGLVTPPRLGPPPPGPCRGPQMADGLFFVMAV